MKKISKEQARAKLAQVIEHFRERSERERRALNEANTRKDFILPMFAALGWDTDDSREVAEEVRVNQTWADYAFKLEAVTRFYLEAKAAGEDLEREDYAEQAVSYAYNKGIPWAILTNFERLKLFNAEWDVADVSRLRVVDLHYDEYLDTFDDLWALSPQSVKNDGIRKAFERRGGAVRRAQPVDARLFELFKTWRLDLIEMFVHYLPKDTRLRLGDIDEAVQRILDRLIFIRTTEDREIEEPRLSRIYARRQPGPGKRASGPDAWDSLKTLFREMDGIYDSNLFQPHLADQLNGDEAVFLPILKELYTPGGVAFRFNFSAIEADVLGRVYEQYLGHVAQTIKSEIKRGDQFYMPGMEPANAQSVELVSKQAKRKQQGIYYTPKYIVDYIVDQTLGRLLEERGGDEDFVRHLTVLDPACGSGSFLIAAYDRLLRFYAEVRQLQGPEHLSQDERVEILLRHIYGVDLDAQAVEIARLNLILRALKSSQLLPELDDNIVRGNSLISGDAETLEGYFGATWRDKHPLNWEERFPEIMARGGFDVVIGNPPYVRVQTLDRVERLFFTNCYETAKGSYDVYVPFVERGLSLLKGTGRLGYILPNKFFVTEYGDALRTLLAKGQHLTQVVNFGDQQIFEGATTYTCLLFLTKAPSTFLKYTEVDSLEKWQNKASVSHEIPAQRMTSGTWKFVVGRDASLFERLTENPVRLSDVAERIFQGLVTSADAVYLLEPVKVLDNGLLTVKSEATGKQHTLEAEVVHPLLKGARDIHRYIATPSKYVLFPYDPYKSAKAGAGTLISQSEFEKKYPRAWEYLAENAHLLRNRESGKMRHDGWYGYVYPKSITLFSKPKILTPAIAQRASFTLDLEGKYYFVGSGGGGGGGYGIVLDDNYLLAYEYILGLLNSRLLDYYLQHISTPFHGGYFAYNRQYIEQLPIHVADFGNPHELRQHNQLVAYVRLLLSLYEARYSLANIDEKEDIERQIVELENALDELVYQLYGLTEEEIAIVEGRG